MRFLLALALCVAVVYGHGDAVKQQLKSYNQLANALDKASAAARRGGTEDALDLSKVLSSQAKIIRREMEEAAEDAAAAQKAYDNKVKNILKDLNEAGVNAEKRAFNAIGSTKLDLGTGPLSGGPFGKGLVDYIKQALG